MSVTTTAERFISVTTTAPRNWIPIVLQLRRQTTLPCDPEKDPAVTVAQLNGDGSLFVDWAGVEALARAAPLVPGGCCEIAHLMLALRERRFADAPKDFIYPPPFPPETVEPA